MNRQRKRALSILRSKRRNLMISLIKSAEVKLETIKTATGKVKQPEFLLYKGGELFGIATGFTPGQAIRIELENLENLLEAAKIQLSDFHDGLDTIFVRLSSSKP